MGSNGICVPPVNPGSIPVDIGENPGLLPVDVGENPGRRGGSSARSADADYGSLTFRPTGSPNDSAPVTGSRS